MRDVRVLELESTIAASYCGRLFAAAGAEVVMHEPPDGAPLRREGVWSAHDFSLFHEYLSAGKRSTRRARDGQLDERALRWADVIISACDGDPDRIMARDATIKRINPAAVHIVTSGFGLTGPCRTWTATSLTDWASGGYLFITGSPDREPVQGGGPWPSYITGATAAVAAQAALLHAVRTGEGQLVDIACMEAVASAHQWSLTMVTHVGAVKGRWGTRFGETYHPMSLFRCADDRWVCIGATTRDQWENFCITVDAVELLADDALFAPGVRFERADEIDAAAQPWLDARSATQAVTELQAARVPASEVLDYAEVLAMTQLDDRQFLVDRSDLAPGARMPGLPFRVGGFSPGATAPDLGADDDWFEAALAAPPPARTLPVIDLADVRIMEFSLAWAGPLTGRFLGDLGANVIKVEHPASRGLGTAGVRPERDGLDAWKWGELAPASTRAEIFPDADPGQRPWNRMGVWNKMNRSKRSFCLDAKAPGGAEVLARLVADVDVLVHNYSPRGARSLGITHEDLCAHNERIVSVAMTGYGETGPMAAYSSYGPILEACGGFDQATGYVDEAPIRVGVAMPDAVGGLHGAFAVLAALWERGATNGAVHVDLSQLETLLSIAGESLLWTSTQGAAPRPVGNRSRDLAPQGVYACAGNERWIAISIQDDARWQRFCGILGALMPTGWEHADLDARRQDHDELDRIIGRWTASRSAEDVGALLQGAGIAACLAYTSRDLVEHEHLRHRGLMVVLDHPDIGPRAFPGTPIHMERTPVRVWRAPMLGEHNDEVLRRLGYDDADAIRLRRCGAIADEPPD